MLKQILLIVLFCACAGRGLAQADEGEENLKAVFIYNFTKYIDWGPAASNDDFVIGIIGPSTISTSLTEIAKTNTVNNKHISIRHFNKPEEIAYCNILFIPHNSPFALNSILDKLDHGVLTVSEDEGFAKRGTAFNFVIKHDKLKFEANLKAIDSAGLKAGSQLLKLATIIDQ